MNLFCFGVVHIYCHKSTKHFLPKLFMKYHIKTVLVTVIYNLEKTSEKTFCSHLLVPRALKCVSANIAGMVAYHISSFLIGLVFEFFMEKKVKRIEDLEITHFCSKKS